MPSLLERGRFDGFANWFDIFVTGGRAKVNSGLQILGAKCFCDYFEAFFPSWGDFDVIFKVFLFAVFILSKPICFNERGGKYFDTNFDQQKNWALQFEGFHLFITHSMEIYWMKSVIRTHSSLLIFIDDPNKNLFLQTWIKVPLNVWSFFWLDLHHPRDRVTSLYIESQSHLIMSRE